ncbi:MAG: hypothetical protein SVV67_08010 [Bacillota bacterium]|nr:hypothetical protein [Bacillota bacterium]
MKKGCVERVRLRKYLPLVPLTLAIIMIILLMAGNVFAVDYDIFTHSSRYNLGGKIDITREIGHACTTGAVVKQNVSGYGELTRSEDVTIANHIMTATSETDWRTAEDAIQNLVVTSTIDLCARPMSAAAHAYSYNGFTIEEGDLINPYHPLVVAGLIQVEPLTSQMLKTEIEANRGERGSYYLDIRAAYGPGPYHENVDEELNPFYGEDFRWWFDDSVKGGIDRGDYYVGNYVEIDQYAYTSYGEMKRFLDMSSPFSTGIITEDMTVTGMSEVKEAFYMDNLEPGPKAIRLTWWELFF